MIKTIIFDYNGLFGPDSEDWASYRDFADKSGLSDEQLTKIFESFGYGIFEGTKLLRDFINEVVKKSHNKLTADELLKIYLEDMFVYREMFDLAKELKKKGLNLVVLSNETREAMDYKTERFKLKNIFSAIYCSAYMGMLKKNPTAFQIVINEQKINPQETLFVDDREHNVEVAKTFGIKGIVYKDLEQLKKDLKKYINF